MPLSDVQLPGGMQKESGNGSGKILIQPSNHLQPLASALNVHQDHTGSC